MGANITFREKSARRPSKKGWIKGTAQKKVMGESLRRLKLRKKTLRMCPNRFGAQVLSTGSNRVGIFYRWARGWPRSPGKWRLTLIYGRSAEGTDASWLLPSFFKRPLTLLLHGFCQPHVCMDVQRNTAVVAILIKSSENPYC